jgi:hypothetical protein
MKRLFHRKSMSDDVLKLFGASNNSGCRPPALLTLE